MILNRDVFNKILDAAVKAGDLVIQTPTGEVIGEHHAGLHHANDFMVVATPIRSQTQQGPRPGTARPRPSARPHNLANPNSDGYPGI